MNTPDEFWANVNASGDDCWPWLAGTSNGRGRVYWNGADQYAYRVAYEIEHGPIPPGLFACHRCDNPLCVRPAHIFLGTHLDNMRDAAEKGRMTHWNQRRGEAHHNVSVSDEAVREARESYFQGVLTQQAIADITGASQVTVGNWLRGETRVAAGGPTAVVGKGKSPTRYRRAS